MEQAEWNGPALIVIRALEWQSIGYLSYRLLYANMNSSEDLDNITPSSLQFGDSSSPMKDFKMIVAPPHLFYSYIVDEAGSIA